MKNKDGLYLSSGNNYTSFTQNIIYHIKIIDSKNIEIYIKNNNDTDTNKYTNKNIIRYKVI
jgi:hypothetical protein